MKTVYISNKPSKKDLKKINKELNNKSILISALSVNKGMLLIVQ